MDNKNDPYREYVSDILAKVNAIKRDSMIKMETYYHKDKDLNIEILRYQCRGSKRYNYSLSYMGQWVRDSSGNYVIMDEGQLHTTLCYYLKRDKFVVPSGDQLDLFSGMQI